MGNLYLYLFCQLSESYSQQEKGVKNYDKAELTKNTVHENNILEYLTFPISAMKHINKKLLSVRLVSVRTICL